MEDQSRYLLPVYTRYPMEIAFGDGCYVTDTRGKRYLDFISGVGVNALGYNHPRITAAISEQARLCVHTSNLVEHSYQAPLAARLCQSAGLDRAFFSNSGTEAMEAAFKAVRAYWSGRDRRTKIVALRKSFHGRTIGSLSLTGQSSLRDLFEPLPGPVTFVDPNDLDALRGAVDAQTAAVVVEPVMGEGGVIPLSDEFLQSARAWTDEVDALLVADETQCGLGRTGKMWAFQWSRILPDIVTTAKPLAGGLPLGATLFSERAASGLTSHSHGSTFGGGPLACRTALEFLSVLDELLPAIGAVAAELREAMDALRERHPSIVEIRSKGLMLGLQLDQPAHAVVGSALQRGLLVNATQGSVVRLLPPYILGSAQVGEGAEKLNEALGVAESLVR